MAVAVQAKILLMRTGNSVSPWIQQEGRHFTHPAAVEASFLQLILKSFKENVFSTNLVVLVLVLVIFSCV